MAEPPALGMPARLLAEEMVLRSILEVLEQLMPGAKQVVFDAAHERLRAKGPKTEAEEGFYQQAHLAIDEIMQAALDVELSVRRRADGIEHPEPAAP